MRRLAARKRIGQRTCLADITGAAIGDGQYGRGGIRRIHLENNTLRAFPQDSPMSLFHPLDAAALAITSGIDEEAMR